MPSGTPAVVEGLLAALRNGAVGMRFRAAASLGQLGSGTLAVVESLLAALSDDDTAVRSRVAASLSQFGNTSSTLTSIWLEGLQRSESWSTRRECAQSLGDYSVADTEVVDALLQGLLGQDNDVRMACGTALARLTKRFPDTKLIIEQKLIEAIDDPEFEERDNISVSNRTGQDYAHEALWQVVS